jgi:hypothetical protein
MSYLSQPATKISYGVTLIGDHIDVDADGIISIPQDVSPTSDVIFDEVHAATGLTLAGETVVTSVTPAASDGISLSAVTTAGPHSAFTVKNTGVLSLISGPGITLSGSTGNITVSAVGADLIAVYGTTSNYTATANDEYIGVSSASAVTITLPLGVAGRVYTIKDEYGQGSGKITIAPQPTELVDGKPNYIISVPYQSVSVVFRAGQWRMI